MKNSIASIVAMLFCIPIKAKLIQYVYCDSVMDTYEADVVIRQEDPDIFTVTIVRYMNGELVKYVVAITNKPLYYNRRKYYYAIDADETEYGARLHNDSIDLYTIEDFDNGLEGNYISIFTK